MTGNVHIPDGFLIGKRDFDYILDIRASRADKHEFMVFEKRSRFSLKMEWAVHNFLYKLGIAKVRTKDVDLDWPQKWYVTAAYIVGGMLSWLFIK